MQVFDVDGTGTLDLSEFVRMFCVSDAFKFKALASSESDSTLKVTPRCRSQVNAEVKEEILKAQQEADKLPG